MLKVILLSIGIIFASLPYVNTVTVDPNTANNGESILPAFYDLFLRLTASNCHFVYF